MSSLPVPVVSVILANAAGEVLLQLRDDDPALLFPGHWTIPGGYVEAGETPLEAIRRELVEEMALTVPLRPWWLYRAPRADFTVEQTLYLGRLDVPAADLPLTEGQRVAFFDAEAIAGMTLAFGYTPVLAHYFARGRSAGWFSE